MATLEMRCRCSGASAETVRGGFCGVQGRVLQLQAPSAQHSTTEHKKEGHTTAQHTNRRTGKDTPRHVLSRPQAGLAARLAWAAPGLGP